MILENKSEIINIRIDSKLKEEASKIAFKNGTNLSELVRRFLKEYVKVDCEDKEI